MSRVLSVVIMGCLLQLVSAQESVPPGTTRNDHVAAALWRIASATQTRIGFEATDIVRISGRIDRIPSVSVSTLEDSLDAVVGADDRYEWRRVGEVVVVRPKGAWDNPSNPFNRPMRNVHVESVPASDVILGLRDFIYTGQFAVPSRAAIAPPISFDVPSGTVISVLNRLIGAADEILWIASYRPIGQPADRFPSWDLDLQVRNSAMLQATSSSHPPARH